MKFEVPGEPVPKARPRFTLKAGRARVYTPGRTEAFEKRVRFFALAAKVRPTKEQVVLSVAFYLGSRRRVDLDNLVKGVKDALNGAAWNDDSQVVQLFASKQVDKANPRCVVTIEPIKEVA